MVASDCPKRTAMANRICEHVLHACGVSNTGHLASVLLEPPLFCFFCLSLASPFLLLLQLTAQPQVVGKGCVRSCPRALRWVLWLLQNCNPAQTIYTWRFCERRFLHAQWQVLDCSSRICSHQTCTSFCLAAPESSPRECSVCHWVYRGMLGTSPHLRCRLASSRWSIVCDMMTLDTEKGAISYNANHLLLWETKT